MNAVSARGCAWRPLLLGVVLFVGGGTAKAQNVLVAGRESDATWITDVQTKIAATGILSGTVDQFNLATGSPSPGLLRQYNAVLVWTDGGFTNGVAVGDSLADYVDCGGGVVVATFAFSIALAGRWSTGGYTPIQIAAQAQGTPLTLGTVFDAAHPIMSGVASFSGGTASYHNTGAPAAGAISIANWSNDRPLVVELPGFNGRIVGLNFFPPSIDVRADFWDSSTDGAKLLANALKYVAAGVTATVNAPVVAAGSDATVGVTGASAFPCVTAAKVFYRKVGGPETFTELAMAESAPGARDWSAVIPGGQVGMDGTQFYVEFQGTGVSRLPAAAPAICSTVRVNRSTTIAVPSGGYALLGVPFAPANPAPEAVFDELGAYDRKVWRYGTYDASANPPAYREPPAATGVVPGQGFWVRAKDATSAAVAGRSTDLPTNVRITLRQGFNQISNPYSFPVNTTDLVLPAPVERNLISYASGSYLAGNATLSPGVGYWIKNNGPGNQVMEIPAFTPPSPSPAPSFPGALGEDEAGWSVAARASAGGFADVGNRFGARPGATDAKDAFDYSDPPAPPEGYVTLSLLGEEGTPLMSDYRAESADGGRWRLELASDQTGQAYRIEFDVERELPSGWVVRAYGPGGLRETDLTAAGELVGTVGAAPFTREWTIAAGTAEWTETVRAELLRSATEFSFTSPIPNPSRGPFFELALPEAGRVSARVYDVTGRAVRTLVDARLDRGHHLIEWNGADGAGRRVANGVYFVRLQTDGHDESRKVVLLK